MNFCVPKISVVICTYNREELLGQAVSSLVDETLDQSLYEILIVNNRSTDGTQELAERFAAAHGNIRVFVEPEQGLSHARNRGWREARGRYVAYIDDDAKATPEWGEKVLQAFDSVDPRPVAVGGEIHPFYETTPPAWFTDDFEIRTWGNKPGFLDPARARHGFSGSNMTFHRAILEEFDGFSSEYGMHGEQMRLGEDAELFSRIYQKYPLFWYDPAILVYHWTPTRNMQVSYRFMRAFRSCQAGARMQNKRFSLPDTMLGFADILLYVLKSPISLVKSQDSLKTQLVKHLEELGGRLGFLCGGRF